MPKICFLDIWLCVPWLLSRLQVNTCSFCQHSYNYLIRALHDSSLGLTLFLCLFKRIRFFLCLSMVVVLLVQIMILVVLLLLAPSSCFFSFSCVVVAVPITVAYGGDGGGTGWWWWWWCECHTPLSMRIHCLVAGGLSTNH